MDAYIYDNFYKTSLRFIQHYAETVTPRSLVRNTQQHKEVLLELATIYDNLLHFSCYKNFFSLSPQQYTKIHTSKLYLVYHNSFIEELFQKSRNTLVEIQEIKNLIEQNIKDDTLCVDDCQYHPYEQIIHQGKTAIHIFGLYQKTLSGSYCFFLVDCILENKNHDKDQRTYKLKKNENYCTKKYTQYTNYLKDEENKNKDKNNNSSNSNKTVNKKKTLGSFYKENDISPKILYSRFKRYYGCSFKQFLLQQQLLQALFLIIYSRKSLKEIAHKVGFEDYSNFQKVFKRCGITPSHIKRIYF